MSEDSGFGLLRSRDTEPSGQGCSEATIPCDFIPSLYTDPYATWFPFQMSQAWGSGWTIMGGNVCL